MKPNDRAEPPRFAASDPVTCWARSYSSDLQSAGVHQIFNELVVQVPSQFFTGIINEVNKRGFRQCGSSIQGHKHRMQKAPEAFIHRTAGLFAQGQWNDGVGGNSFVNLSAVEKHGELPPQTDSGQTLRCPKVAVFCPRYRRFKESLD